MLEPSTGKAPRYTLTPLGIWRRHRALWFSILFLAVAATVPTAALAQVAKPQTRLPSIVIDRQTGSVLLENRAFDRWYPASLTKLMTIYVTLRALTAGEIAPGSPVTVSQKAAREQPSKMFYAPGTQLRFDTALKILIVKSANDVAMAIAESVAGSEAAFVARMNSEAARIGMRDSQFANPNGLHDPAQYTSARDMALLARRIVEEFPQYAPYFAIPAIKAGEKVEHSYNLLLERFAGADGLKTGFVCASGYNMVASATRGGRQVIAVVFGTNSQTDRAVEAAQLLLQGFEQQGGPSIETHVSGKPPVAPKSQRSKMCSEAALKARYDPAPGDVVIKSQILSPRTPGRPVAVSTGGIDAPPSAAVLQAQSAADKTAQASAAKSPAKGRIPIPTRRPAYNPAASVSQ
ncbi:MAG TPA: D-alanyl-D-alanine carboxypeptidase family protein [Rhizobiaceae bacterium]|nr:D-alanyl-D-alanine carboxypeptidase family protein [Rhizobiaceae bacterium]